MAPAATKRWVLDLCDADAFRWAPQHATEPGFREWHHFCVLGADVDVLINFNILGGHGGRPAAGQVAVLVGRGAWHGGVERIALPELRVRAGQVSASFGDNHLTYDGEYHVRVAAGGVTCDLHFRPVAEPFLANNIDPASATSLSWLVVPRLLVTGSLAVDGQLHTFCDAAGYHDHNWGRWGVECVWDWGFGLPDDVQSAHSAVFVRLCDRARSEVRLQGLFMWEGARLRRVIRDGDLRFESAGALSTPTLYKVPPVLRLLAPGTSTGVPGRLDVAYADGDERGVLRFVSQGAAQLLAPEERPGGVLAINEVSASFEIDGDLGGRAVHACGRGLFEHVTAR
jgi:hypothetical protein